MILLDYSQVAIAAYMETVRDEDFDLELFRHTTLNSIKGINHRFANEYGEMVICVDSSNTWRREVFPYYKAKRAKKRKESKIDWNQVYQALDILKNELKEYFPYKVIEVAGAEADDIIAVLARKCCKEAEDCLIASRDKDFIQLQIDNIWVRQWNNVTKEFITHPDPKKFLFEHVIRGDDGDGIPNVLSPADSFVTGTRQKSVFQKKLDEWWETGECPVIATPRFKENVTLIDLRQIPKEIQSRILRAYEEYPERDKSRVLEYLSKNRLKTLFKDAAQF